MLFISVYTWFALSCLMPSCCNKHKSYAAVRCDQEKVSVATNWFVSSTMVQITRSVRYALVV